MYIAITYSYSVKIINMSESIQYICTLEVKINFEFKKEVGIAIKSKETSR